MLKTALIDGDIIPYKCGFATQQSTHETVDGAIHATKTQAEKHIEAQAEAGVPIAATITTYVETEPLNHALKLAKNLIDKVMDQTGADDYEIWLSGAKNFRTAIATIKPYKGNRTADKPLHFEAIREYLIDKRGAHVTDGIEADDALGIVQVGAAGAGGDTVICTIDKDLNMIPGDHYNWDTDTYYHVTEQEGYRNFYFQLLTGDPTDNITGCPGIGKKKAQAILAGLTSEVELFTACVKAYRACKKFANDDEADEALEENAHLLWILRYVGFGYERPIDFDKIGE